MGPVDVDRNGSEVLGREECLDAVGDSGWNVVVIGVAWEVPDAGIDPGERVRLARWVPSADDRVMGISTQLASGRRIVAGVTRDWQPMVPAIQGAKT
jgi:hypothetical protein